MKITTKFETGNKVYFYNLGQINQGKIIHIDISANGGTDIVYRIERNDRQYKDWNDYEKGHYLRLRYCNHEEEVRNDFNENEIADTKDGLLKILLRKELIRHREELHRINNL